MPEWLDKIFDLLAQFTGGREPSGPHIVWFGIAAACWLTLALIAQSRRQLHSAPRESLLLLAFTFGFAREALMLIVKFAEAMNWLDPLYLHVVFPPAEHALQNIAMLLVAAAFMRFLSEDKSIARQYIRLGLLLIILCYVSTFWWWARYILRNPASSFGKTWCDVLFHTVISVLLVYAIQHLIRQAGGWMRAPVCGALVCFLLHQFWKIPDIYSDEVYSPIITPIRHAFYLLAIPLLGYVYIRELFLELARSIDSQRLAAIGEAMTSLIHESRNAFAKHQAGLNLLHRALNDRPELRHYVNEALDSQSELRTLFESVRSFAAPQQIIKTAQHVPELVNNVWNSIRMSEPERDIELTQHDDGNAIDCPLDARLMSGVFRNLMENSLAACADPVRLEIQYRSAHIGLRPALRITYSDNGPGLTKEQSERIFDAFYTTRIHGTGLGMAISKRTVEGHDGWMAVAPSNGQGATFTIVLPR